MADAVTFSLEGAEELLQELKALPKDWQAAADEVIRATAEAFARDVQSQYPTGPRPRSKSKRGVPLREGIIVQPKGELRYHVVNKAVHAAMWEFGTAQRFNPRHGGARGAMSPRPTWVPRAVRHRRAMIERLKALTERFGFQVSGSAE